MNDLELTRYVSDGVDAAKAGKAIETYYETLPYFEHGKLDSKSHYPFGWIIYYALHQSRDNEIVERKKMLANYMRLSLRKPHKLHSMILTEAIRLYKDTYDVAFNWHGDDKPIFSIISFTSLWDIANLRPGDWRRKEHEGKILSSTAEKLITCLVDEAESKKVQLSPDMTAVVDKAVADYPDTPMLLSQRASLHTLGGERDKATDLLRKAIILAPGKYFLWQKLAMLIDPATDMRLHVALLHKALSAPGPEQYKGRIRLSLASALASKEAYAHALWELSKVKYIYESNNWHLPRVYEEVMRKIPEGIAPADPAHIYFKLSRLADNVIYDSLPEVIVRKTYHKNPGPGGSGSYRKPMAAWRVTDELGRNYWIQPSRYGIAEDLPIGTRVTVKIHNGKPVKASLVADE